MELDKLDELFPVDDNFEHPLLDSDPITGEENKKEEEEILEDIGELPEIDDAADYQDFSTTLIKLKDLGLDELPSDVELTNDTVINNDLFTKIVTHNLTRVKEETKASVEAELLSPLSEKLIKAIAYEHNGGDSSEFFKLYGAVEDLTKLDPTNDKDAETIVLNFYKDNLGEDDAKALVLSLSEANLLTKKAGEIHPKLIKNQESIIAAENEKKIKLKEYNEQQEGFLMNNLSEAIKTSTNYKLSQKEAIDVFNTLFEEVQVNYGKNPLGEEVVKTQKKYEYYLQRLLRDPGANKDKLLEIAMILDPEDKYNDIINRKRIEKVTKDVITKTALTTRNTNRFDGFKKTK